MAQERESSYDHYVVYDNDQPSTSELGMRRAEALKRMPPGSALLVRSADIRNRSNDVDYSFRQRSGMLYLTSLQETDGALVLVRPTGDSAGTRGRAVLFSKARETSAEIWTGPIMGPLTAGRISGIIDSRSATLLRPYLDSLLPTLSTLYYDGWSASLIEEPLLDSTIDLERSLRYVLKSRYGRLTVKSGSEILSAMRRVKSPTEITLMRKAIAATIAGHRATIRSARPGMFEYELEATMEYEFARHGAESPGYPSIVGSGPNSCILHYETNRRQTAGGDLVMMDCGAEYHGYSADVSRTFPVSGRFTPEQRAIYDLVLKAQQEGIDACRAGNYFLEPHHRAQRILAQGLIDLGIIGDVAELDRYFPHGTSHYLGLDVHDVGNLAAKLEPGVVLTVEPGIYIPAGSPCDPKWWNIGVRIEDDILVTDNDPDNLSGALERTAYDIERLMREGNRE